MFCKFGLCGPFAPNKCGTPFDTLGTQSSGHGSLGPEGPRRHFLEHPAFRGHSRELSPDSLGPKGPRDTCSWSGGSQISGPEILILRFCRAALGWVFSLGGSGECQGNCPQISQRVLRRVFPANFFGESFLRVFWPCFQGRITQTQTFWSGYLRVGEGVGAEKFGMSLQTREIIFFFDFAGMSRRCPKSLRNESSCSIFFPMFLQGRKIHAQNWWHSSP